MDITSMSPVTGRLVKEDGSIYNIADALSNGSEPVTSQTVPIHAMSPRTGRMVREDGTIVNVAELIEELLSSGGGTGTTNYNNLTNKPSINGVELKGNLSSEDLGLVLSDPQKSLEQAIGNYYALRRTGKVYQTKLWKFTSNPTSSGEKMLDNSGLVFKPSTDSEI